MRQLNNPTLEKHPIERDNESNEIVGNQKLQLKICTIFYSYCITYVRHVVLGTQVNWVFELLF